MPPRWGGVKGPMQFSGNPPGMGLQWASIAAIGTDWRHMSRLEEGFVLPVGTRVVLS